MQKKFAPLFFIFIVCLVCNAKSQDVSWPVNISNPEMNYTITCIAQDSVGFIWLGTTNGLYRYDGVQYVKYTWNNNLKSISHHFINHLFVDKEGKLWVSTNNGINLYIQEKDAFIQIIPNDKQLNVIRKIFIDSHGIIWALDDYQVYQLQFDADDPSQSTFKRIYSFQGSNLLFTKTIFEDADSSVWIGARDKIGRYSRSERLFYLSKNNVGEILDIVQVNNHLVFIGNSGVWSFPDESDETEVYPRNVSLDGQATTQSFSRMMPAGNYLWLIDVKGNVLKVSAGQCSSDQSLVSLKTMQKVPLKQPVLSAYIDRENTCWLATRNDGLHRIHSQLPSPTHSTVIFDGESCSITSVFKDNHGNLFLGTEQKGLLVQKNETGPYLNVLPGNMVVNSMLQLNDKEYLLAVSGTHGGFMRLQFSEVNNFKKARTFLYQLPKDCPGIKKILRSGNALFRDSDGDIWYADAYSGMVKVEVMGEKKHEVLMTHFFPHERKHTTPITIGVNQIAQDTLGYLWIATESAGLYKFDKVKKKFTNYRSGRSSQFRISHLDITAVHIDANQHVWASAIDGTLNKITFDKKPPVTYGNKDGLLAGYISSLTSDSKGNIWLSTNLGMVRFDIEKQQFTSLKDKPGLKTDGYNYRAHFVDSKGKNYFGTVHGYNSFYLDSFATTFPVEPNLVFTKLLVNNKVVTVNNSGKLVKTKGESINYFTQIVLPHTSNLIKVRFALLSYIFPEEHYFRYRLKGVDTIWNYTSVYRPFALYANFKPGDYNLEVQALYHGEWDKLSRNLTIKVNPPVYHRVYFWILVILLLSLIVGFIIHIRERRLQSERQRLVREVEKRTLLIQRQSSKLERINKRLTDSIAYGNHIQNSFIPAKEMYNKYLADNFIYFQPKEDLSGDFHWIKEISPNRFILVIADCTGHGVPGAMMSMMSISYLNEMANYPIKFSAAEYLDILNKRIVSNLADEKMDSLLKIGLDIGICVIDTENQLLDFSGAYNSMYLFSGNKLRIVKGSRLSLGNTEGKDTAFYSTTIKYQNSDTFYLTTDGFIDQIGGDEEKKYKHRRFIQLLQSIHTLPMLSQLARIDDTFHKWKGANEQTDDVLVMGFKLETNSFNLNVTDEGVKISTFRSNLLSS